MMDWTLALLKNRRGGGHSESGVQRDDHFLLSLVLLLATDAIGASIGAFLRSFIKSSTQPLVCPSESMHQTRKDVGENSKTDILRSESCTSDKESSELLQQLPLPSNIIMKYAPHEPTLLDIRGLRNRGQTCYANSVFQALASLPSFCTYLQYLELKGAKSLGHDLYETMQYVNGHDIGIRPKRRILGKLLFNSSCSPIVYGDPYKVLDIVARNHSQFRSRSGMFAGTSEQQDVHEFLTALMDVLSVEDHDGSRENVMSSKNAHVVNGEQAISLIDSKYYNSDKKSSQIRNENDTSYCISREYQEEKKHEERVVESAAVCQYTKQNRISRDSAIKCPLDGWLGSTIKCNSCHHIRPIRSSPFVALSLSMATSNSPGALENFLASEYGGFASAERVSDVLCLSCAIQKKMTELEEEELMLRGAISSIQKRKIVDGTQQQQPGKQIDQDILGLIKETELLRVAAAHLKSLDPDADEDLGHSNNSMDYFQLIKSSSKLNPIRGDAWKATLLMRPPKILCIHAQRRHFDFRSGQMVKITRHLNFSEVMDLSDFYAFEQQQQFQRRRVGCNLLYRLMSVIEHQGGAFGGHYQTYRRSNWNEGNNSWVLVSDQSVSPRSWNDVRNCQAYMLFYAEL